MAKYVQIKLKIIQFSMSYSVLKNDSENTSFLKRLHENMTLR